MNKIILVTLIASSVSLFESAYAQAVPPASVVNPPTPWVSKNSTDEVTINNGNGNKLTITINVDKNANATNPAGVNIKNCGDTTHIDAGSSAVCTTSDSGNPVTFSSDSPTVKVTGNYIIKQQ